MSADAAAADLRTFARIVPGTAVGEVAVDPADLLADWADAFPDEPVGETLPPGFLVAILMRGYLTLTADRKPAGNVHAGLDLSFGEPARADRPVTVAIRVADAWRRNGRNRVRFALACRQDGTPVLEGTSDVVWAA